MVGHNVLFLHGKGLVKADVDEILEIVANNPNAHTLVLNDNQLKDDGVGLLVDGLSEFKHITHVGLRDNQLGDQCCQYLNKLCHLIELDLSNNNITDKGVAELDELHTLQELDLSGTLVTEDSVLVALDNFSALEELYCNGTAINPEIAFKLRELLRKRTQPVSLGGKKRSWFLVSVSKASLDKAVQTQLGSLKEAIEASKSLQLQVSSGFERSHL